MPLILTPLLKGLQVPMTVWFKLGLCNLLFLLPIGIGGTNTSLNLTTKQEKTLLGKIIVGNEMFEVTYFDNPTTQSLLDQMPFTIVLKDYAKTEMIFYPTKTLNQDNAPSGAEPRAGEIMCYGPWGNVAIFYKNAAYADGLIPMGRIDDVIQFTKVLASNQNKANFIKE